MVNGYHVGQHRLALPFSLRPLAFCSLSQPRTIVQILGEIPSSFLPSFFRATCFCASCPLPSCMSKGLFLCIQPFYPAQGPPSKGCLSSLPLPYLLPSSASSWPMIPCGSTCSPFTVTIPERPVYSSLCVLPSAVGSSPRPHFS